MSFLQSYEALKAELGVAAPVAVDFEPEPEPETIQMNGAERKTHVRRRGANPNLGPYHGVPRRPGEIPLKDFLQTEAKRYGVAPDSIYCRIHRGNLYPGLVLRAATSKAIFVSGDLTGPPMMRPGEKPLKQWVVERAAREGLKPQAVRMRLSRGGYAGVVRVRRLNKRVAFAKEVDCGK